MGVFHVFKIKQMVPNHAKRVIYGLRKLRKIINTFVIIPLLIEVWHQLLIYETFNAIWYHLYNLKNVKNSHEGV